MQGDYKALAGGYRAIIFDKDGTLIGLEGLWGRVYDYAWGRLLDHWQMPPLNDEDYRLMGIDHGVLVPSGIAAMGSILEVFNGVILGRRYDQRCSHQMLQEMYQNFEGYVQEAVKGHLEHVQWLNPEVPKALKYLRDRCDYMGLVTTDSRFNTELMLAHLGLDQYFDYVGCGDDQTPTKPNPHQGLSFLTLTALKPEEVAMVGDSAYDQAFAENLGIDFFHVDRLW